MLRPSDPVVTSDLANALDRLTQAITRVDHRLGILEGNVTTLVEKASANHSNARSISITDHQSPRR